MRRGAADGGFTLLELTAVLAVFSILSVMALNAISGTMRASDRLQTGEDVAIETVAAAALLRRDLQAMAPVTSRPDGSERAQAFAAGPAPGVLDFTVAGQPDMADARPGRLVAVVWRLEGATLVRESRAFGAPDVTHRTEVLHDVTGLEVGVVLPDGRARALPSWRARDPWALPAGVDVRFTTGALGALRVLVAR